MATFAKTIETIAMAIDGAGVVIIVVGLLIAAGRFLFPGRLDAGGAYRRFRHDLGRSILLGLEFLVAGDIIRTVAVAPTLRNVLVLGVIVLIRTFLSMTLQLELEGRWPWQRREKTEAA